MEFEQPTQEQTQGNRSYEESPWIHLSEWMMQEHRNHETGESFWSVRLPDNTYIQHDGQTIDVSRYRFTTRYEPKLLHGEVGFLKAVRGIHYPVDWEITLQRFENIAEEGREPVFKETGRIEGVTPKELAEGLEERSAAWRQAHRREGQEHAVGKDAQEQTHPAHERQRSTEPSL